jgi:hypothetical protein
MRPVIIFLICFAFALAGCSGGSNTPVTPQPNDPGAMGSVPIIGGTLFPDGGFQATGMLGAYEIHINPESATAELIAKRTPAIGEDYIVSGISFFTIAPCATCLKITGVELDADGNAILTFSIAHPFKEGIIGDPPTAVNRLDLDVFDLAMVIAPTESTATTYNLTGATVYTENCTNPDGYTTELANVIGDTAALPYFLVVDDSVSGTGTWNKFAMGTDTTFAVGFNLISGILRFDMYLTMGYGFSAVKMDRLLPKYYNPEFNRKAAWKVVVTPPEGEDAPTMGNTWNNLGVGGPYNVTIDVYDWQIGATVSTEEIFADADASEVFAASEPSSVSVEIPGMNTSLPSVTAPDNPSATGMPDDPWIFTVPVANENHIAAGEYIGLVKVTDERPALTPADGRDFIIDTPDGALLINYEMPEYATYQTFTATVVFGCGPITGSISSPTCPIEHAGNGATFNFTVNATSDNGGGNVILYEVDYDYDGMSFTMDDSNTDGIFTGVGPFIVPGTCEDEIPYDFTVAFRGTDECVPANETIFATCVVTVDSCISPVGDVTIQVNRGSNNQIDYSGPNGPWTLSWTAVAAAEYAIYKDDDGSNGWDDWVELGTTTTASYDVPATEWTAPNHYVPGTMYVVRSRGTIGDAGSESADSQLCFILANGFDTLIPNTAFGTNDTNGEGWRSGLQRGNYPSYFYMQNVSASYYVSGSRSAQIISRYIGNNYYNCDHWAVTVETPLAADIPDSSVRLIESECSFNNDWYWTYDGGVCFGSSESPQPVLGWNYSSFLWADCEDGTEYYSYTANNTVPFDMSNYVSGNRVITWSAPGSHYLIGSDVGTSDTYSFVGIGAYKYHAMSGRYPYMYIDDVSIVIY